MSDTYVRKRFENKERNRGIGLLEAGLSQSQVARLLGVSQDVVGRMWQLYQTHEMHRHGSGYIMSTTQAQDQHDGSVSERYHFK